jgi:hypothetical protein
MKWIFFLKSYVVLNLDGLKKFGCDVSNSTTQGWVCFEPQNSRLISTAFGCSHVSTLTMI